MRHVGYAAVRLCIIAIHIYSIYGDIVYINYTRSLYNGSRLTAVVCEVVYINLCTFYATLLLSCVY